jgi:hypothetical protein
MISVLFNRMMVADINYTKTLEKRRTYLLQKEYAEPEAMILDANVDRLKEIYLHHKELFIARLFHLIEQDDKFPQELSDLFASVESRMKDANKNLYVGTTY